MTDRGRWAGPAHPLVCRHAGPGWPKNAPWPGRITARRCVMGRLLLGVGRQKSEALLSAPPGISATCPASECCRTAGCERGRCSAGCHATPGDGNLLLRLQRGTIPEEYGIGLTACAGREVKTQGERLQDSQASLNSNCQKNRRKQIFISNDASHCVSCRRQRFPTVRMVG